MLNDKEGTNIYTIKYQKEPKQNTKLNQSTSYKYRPLKSAYGKLREISPQEKKIQADKERLERRKNYIPDLKRRPTEAFGAFERGKMLSGIMQRN